MVYDKLGVEAVGLWHFQAVKVLGSYCRNRQTSNLEKEHNGREIRAYLGYLRSNPFGLRGFGMARLRAAISSKRPSRIGFILAIRMYRPERCCELQLLRPNDDSYRRCGQMASPLPPRNVSK